MVTLIENMVSILAIGFTVGCLTLPLGDNVYWKICEHMFLGFAAGYTILIASQTLQANLFGKIGSGEILFVIPLVLSVMLYSRFVKQARWLNRYPIALLVGVGTAISMRTIVDAMLLKQIRSTLINPFATGTAIVGNPATPINNIVVIIGVVAVIIYFVFWEMKWMDNPAISGVRKLGILVLMSGFGIYVANSLVMRVSRLAGRFFFMLSPDNLLATGVFALLGTISLYLARKKEV